MLLRSGYGKKKGRNGASAKLVLELIMQCSTTFLSLPKMRPPPPAGMEWEQFGDCNKICVWGLISVQRWSGNGSFHFCTSINLDFKGTVEREKENQHQKGRETSYIYICICKLSCIMIQSASAPNVALQHTLIRYQRQQLVTLVSLPRSSLNCILICFSCN